MEALIAVVLLVVALGHDRGVRTVPAPSIVPDAVVLVRSFRRVRPAEALRLLVPAALLVVRRHSCWTPTGPRPSPSSQDR